MPGIRSVTKLPEVVIPVTSRVANVRFCGVLAPAIVIVFSAPVPDATTPVPTKFNVVADVDNALPSSSIVIPPPDAFTVTDPPDSAVTV